MDRVADIHIENNTFKNDYIALVLYNGRNIEVRNNAFIDNNHTYLVDEGRFEFDNNYWSSQDHVDMDGDNINDIRYYDLDYDPLYEPYKKPMIMRAIIIKISICLAPFLAILFVIGYINKKSKEKHIKIGGGLIDAY